MNVTIRQLRPDSETDIREWRDLYRVCFGCEFPEKVWRWKYLENPLHPGEPLIWVAERDNRIVGANSVVPSLARISRQKVSAVIQVCQGSNGMVHPDYRRRGILESLIIHYHQQAGARGYRLVYSYPNSLSIGACLKQGSHMVGRITTRRRLVTLSDATARSYLARKGLPRFAYGPLISMGRFVLGLTEPARTVTPFTVKIGPVADFAPDIEHLHEQPAPADGVYGYRGQDFLRWRYSRPDRDYLAFTLYDGRALLAYFILCISRSNRTALAKDLFSIGYDRRLLGALFWQAYQWLKQQSFSSFDVSLLDRDWPFDDLPSLRRGFRRGTRDYFRILIVDDSLDRQFLLNKNHWYFQQVDRSPF